MKLFNVFLNYLLIFIWCATIFWFSSRPQIKTVDSFAVDFFLKKTAHFIEYAILGILSYRATRSIRISILFSILYAASDEFHQSFIPGREPSIRDVIIDSVGVIAGVAICSKLFQKINPKLKK